MIAAADSVNVTDDSEKSPKSVTIKWNQQSRSPGTSGHDGAEYAQGTIALSLNNGSTSSSFRYLFSRLKISDCSI